MARKRPNSPRKQTTSTSFTSARGQGRGGGQLPPTASAERAAARRRKALVHQSATDRNLSEENASSPQAHKKNSAVLSPPNKSQYKISKGKTPFSDDQPSESQDKNLLSCEVQDKEFRSPGRRHLAKIHNKNQTQQPLPLENRYDSLSESEQEDKDDEDEESSSDSESEEEKSDHSASTASVKNTTMPVSKATSSEEPQVNSQEPTSTNADSSELTKEESANHLQRETTQETQGTIVAKPTIDVRSNPSGALAQLEEELQSFSDPIFSPEVAAQVRVEAASGKERNRIQKEKNMQEMEIDSITQTDKESSPPKTTVQSDHLTPKSAPQPPLVFTPIIIDQTSLHSSSDPNLTKKTSPRP